MNFNRHEFVSRVSWPDPQAPITPRSTRRFSRAHTVSSEGVPDIAGSAAKVFHGDDERWNPEQLLLAALAQCHMMSFLFHAHQQGLKVLRYESEAHGVLTLDADGVGGQFSRITLTPRVWVSDQRDRMELETLHAALHSEASAACFIARSVSAPIAVEPQLLHA